MHFPKDKKFFLKEDEQLILSCSSYLVDKTVEVVPPISVHVVPGVSVEVVPLYSGQ